MSEKKKNIGILTMYYSNISHGGLLQAYSLCKKIEEFGYSAEQIKYDYNERFRPTSFFGKFKRLIRKIPYNILCIITKDKSEQKYYSYMEEIPHSRLYKSQEMGSIENEYDIFVVGSDQVWNDLYCDDLFYFPGISKKKVAYAASVGRDKLTKKELEIIAKKTNNFSSISVRENNLKQGLMSVSNKTVDIVCDPVFLNTKEFWEKHSISPEIKEKYVLVYLLGDDKKEQKKVIAMARKTGYKVVTVPNVNLHARFSDLISSDIVKWSVGPKEFLGLINSSEFVFTDSFHCTAFSIIFNKQFYCVDRGGNEKKMNSRIVSILTILGIQDRFIDSNSSKYNVDSVIDYDLVQEKVKKYRRESELWLKKALKSE